MATLSNSHTYGLAVGRTEGKKRRRENFVLRQTTFVLSLSLIVHCFVQLRGEGLESACICLSVGHAFLFLTP